MKEIFLLFLTLFLCIGCSSCSGALDNVPNDPDTPAPEPHVGVFISEYGKIEFTGDGEHIKYDFDEDLAKWTGLPAGKQDATYVFLSGDLPPHGSKPVRYDIAHELQLTVNGQSATIQLGIAAEDGGTASSGNGTVTPTRIPFLFSEDNFFSVDFRKEISYSVRNFFFTESNGGNFDMRVLYELDDEDGVYTATVKPEGVKDENALKVTVNKEFISKLSTILKDNDIERWDGYNERADVLDGIGFVLRVTMTDETKIEATGYMEWPKGYNQFASEIHQLFRELYDENR